MYLFIYFFLILFIYIYIFHTYFHTSLYYDETQSSKHHHYMVMDWNMISALFVVHDHYLLPSILPTRTNVPNHRLLRSEKLES